MRNRSRSSRIVPYIRPPSVLQMATAPTKEEMRARRKAAALLAKEKAQARLARKVASAEEKRLERKKRASAKRKQARRRAKRQQRAEKQMWAADAAARRTARRAAAAASRVRNLIEAQIHEAVEPHRHFAAVQCVLANAASHRAMVCAMRAAHDALNHARAASAATRASAVAIHGAAKAACECARAAAMYAAVKRRPVTRMAAEMRWSAVIARAHANPLPRWARWRAGFQVLPRAMSAMALRFWQFERQHRGWEALDRLIETDKTAHPLSEAGKRHKERSARVFNLADAPCVAVDPESQRQRFHWWGWGQIKKKVKKIYVESDADRYHREKKEAARNRTSKCDEARAVWLKANGKGNALV